MGMRPPSLPILAAHLKPLHLCSVMLRMMSLMAAMHPWELCTKVRGHNWGAERSNLLLFVMLLLVVMVVVDVMVVVVLSKLQIIKDGGGKGHQTYECCLKPTQLG